MSKSSSVEADPYDVGSRSSAEGQRQQPADLNPASQDHPRDRCVPELVAAQAAARPGAVALRAGSEVLTYGELDASATRLAQRLRGLGTGTDVVVGLCLERSFNMVAGALGILRAGGAYLPLDSAYPSERLAWMLNDARAPVLVTNQRQAERLPPGPWRVLTLDRPQAEIATPLAAVPPNAPHPGDLAYVIYTSGSTGQPKGVEIAHASLLNLIFWHQHAFAVTSADRATQLASPGFDATVWELWPYLTAGASVHLADEAARLVPELLRDWLVAQRITISFVPTALAEHLLALEWPAGTPLRILLTGAEALQRYPRTGLPFTLVNNYGPTECTVVATSGPVLPGEPTDTPPSIGRPIANTQAYILGDDMKPLPFGAAGELYVGGAGLARGYRNSPALTRESFSPNPFQPGTRLYRTGDLARYLPDGQIAFLGRVDDQIKIRGYRIEPNEIVTVLDQHPALRASVVIAREDTPGEKRLVAYVVPASHPAPTAGALNEFLRARLPDHMVPAAFVCLDSLPLTQNGKVDRAALPAPDPTSTLRDDNFQAPSTLVEKRLAEILSALLGVEQVGTNDNFFLLGGHSLLGTQLITRVRNAFGVELTLRSLFDNPTLAGISAGIERLMLAKQRRV